MNTIISDKETSALLSSDIISGLLDKIGILESSNQKLEEFAFVASHDLKEPLRKILMHESIIRHLLPEHGNEDIKRHLDKIITASERMQQLIDDILSYASIKNISGNFQQVELNQLLKNVCNDLEDSITKNNVILESDKLPVVKGDPTQIRQVFQNLISNAIKFRFEFPDPVIQIKNKGIVALENIDHEIETNFNKEKLSYFQIDIIDNGIGFEIEEKEKIFQLFSRLHSKDIYSGSGIGLAIVKQVMDQHMGKILVNSKPGKGSTFSLLFPNTLV